MLPVIIAIISRWIKDKVTQNRNDINSDISVNYLSLTRKLIFMYAAIETDFEVRKGVGCQQIL